MKRLFKQRRGFTIFFATLVASLALAIGLAIFDITSRQLSLSTTVAQSEYAIYAADSGTECALYWDAKYNNLGSAFATSSAFAASASGITCGPYDVSVDGTPPSPYAAPPTNWSPWSVVSTSNAATTTFTLTFPGYSYCAVVEVAKHTNADGSISTDIYSHGYNTCISGAQNQLERELKVSY